MPDLRGKLPGRGVWVTCAATKVAEAAASCSPGASGRNARRRPIWRKNGALLRQEALACLSLANKAGLVSAGFERVAGEARKGRLAVLVEAADGGSGRTAKTGRKTQGGRDFPRNNRSLRIPELGLALGQSHVIHAAIAEGGLPANFRSGAPVCSIPGALSCWTQESR